MDTQLFAFFLSFYLKQCQGIEGLLQENLRLGPQQGLNLGWGDDLEASRFGPWIPVKPKISIPRRREFLPVGSAGGRSPPSLAIDGMAREEPAGTPPMPRITLRFAGKQIHFKDNHSGDPTNLTGAVGALHERDPGLAKLGGEPTRALALRTMRASAAALFAFRSRKLFILATTSLSHFSVALLTILP